MAAGRLRRALSAALVCVAMLAGCSAAQAATRVRIQTVTVAGVGHHGAAQVWPHLHQGDALDLVREADNPHDPLAVRVDWQGRTLGYIPRDQSGPVAAALDAARQLSARIARLRDHPNPRERILIDVFVELP